MRDSPSKCVHHVPEHLFTMCPVYGGYGIDGSCLNHSDRWTCRRRDPLTPTLSPLSGGEGDRGRCATPPSPGLQRSSRPDDRSGPMGKKTARVTPFFPLAPGTGERVGVRGLANGVAIDSVAQWQSVNTVNHLEGGAGGSGCRVPGASGKHRAWHHPPPCPAPARGAETPASSDWAVRRKAHMRLPSDGAQRQACCRRGSTTASSGSSAATSS